MGGESSAGTGREAGVDLIAQRWVSVDGITVHYVTAGDGPPLLLLHGLGASHLVWQSNIVPLAEQYTVIAPDLPGHGDSDKPRMDYSVGAGVRLVAGFLEAVGVSQLVGLVGNSLGGMLALRAAVALPTLTQSLVLVDSGGLGRELPLAVRLLTVPFLGEIMRHPKLGGSRFVLKSVFYDPSKVSPDLADQLRHIWAMPGAREAVLRALRHAATLRGLRRELMLLGALRELSMPLLIVWGARDRVIPVAHARAAAQQARDVRLEIIPQCGHWPQMEAPEVFNPLLMEFLGQVRTRMAGVAS